MVQHLWSRRDFIKKAVLITGLASGGILLSQTLHVFPPLTHASALQVASTKDLGAVGKPSSVLVRDGGATVRLGNQLLWTFGDTLLRDNHTILSNTAALADIHHPLVTHEPLDARGLPYQLIPFTPEEQAYNELTGKPDDRIAIWPTSIINYQDQGLIFSYKLHIKPGFLNYEFLGIVLALVRSGETQATRLPGLLFSNPEPGFANPMVYQGMVYVYGGNHAANNPYVVARVPLDQVTNRRAYTFWDGKTWSSDVSNAQPVFTGIPGAVTISYNDYLGRFLVTYSQPFSTNILMCTGPEPVGSWSEPIVAFRGLSPFSNGYNYAGIEHPELARYEGRTVYVSYFNATGPFSGDLHLVEVNFV